MVVVRLLEIRILLIEQVVLVLGVLLVRVPVVMPLGILRGTCVQLLLLFLNWMHPCWQFLGGFGRGKGLIDVLMLQELSP